MRRLIRFAAKLYPRSWQERYGAEFGALLEDSQSSWRASLDVLRGALIMQIHTWSPRWVVAVVAIGGAVLAAAGSYAFPSKYESSAVLIYRTTTVDYTRSDLLHLVQRVTAGEDTGNVRVEILGPVAFRIAVQSHDPVVAQRVTQNLVAKAIGENLRAGEDHRPSGALIVAFSPSLPKTPIPPQRFSVSFSLNRLNISLAGLAAGLLLGVLFAFVRRVAPKPANP